MPIGLAILALGTALALRPPRPARSSRFNLAYLVSYAPSEAPVLVLALLLVSTLPPLVAGDVDSPGSWVGVGVAGLTCVGLVVLARRGLLARPALERVLGEGLARPRGLLSVARLLLFPLPIRPRAVERLRGIPYGDAGGAHRLDVYRHRGHPAGAPVLVHMHGGGFFSGVKSMEARALLHRLARQGWVCVSANYRLRGQGAFPAPLTDLKRVIAWVREHADEHRADPSALFVAGSSAGAHLASMAALTPGNPAFQPGFEQADTSVTAAIGLNGYYGPRSAGVPSSPIDYVGPHAPPFLLVHGDLDTVVIPEDARRFAARLKNASKQPVLYAELPRTQHGFDLFRTPRFEAVVCAIEAFAERVRATPPVGPTRGPMRSYLDPESRRPLSQIGGVAGGSPASEPPSSPHRSRRIRARIELCESLGRKSPGPSSSRGVDSDP
jgi:acetyl esterase/lipase